MRRFLCFLLFLALVVLPLDLRLEIPGRQESAPSADTAPESTDAEAPVTGDTLVSRESILRLLEQEDPDGYYLIRSTENQDDFLNWLDTSRTIGEEIMEIGTAVHEQCHAYCGTPTGGMQNKITGHLMSASEWIYTGSGQRIEVPHTEVFFSSEMAAGVPESLRTARFNPYINGDPDMASNLEGPYGLLNEFTAYCWGAQTRSRLEKYRKKAANQIVYTGDFVAYAEFRFYILRYMLYAREHYPDVYAGIMENDAFRQAFTLIDARFAKIAEAEKNEAYIDEWNVLTEELQKPEYVEMARLLAR